MSSYFGIDLDWSFRSLPVMVLLVSQHRVCLFPPGGSFFFFFFTDECLKGIYIYRERERAIMRSSSNNTCTYLIGLSDGFEVDMRVVFGGKRVFVGMACPDKSCVSLLDLVNRGMLGYVEELIEKIFGISHK